MLKRTILVLTLLVLPGLALSAQVIDDATYLDGLILHTAAVGDPVGDPANDGFVPFEACDELLENFTGKPQTHTITICNKSESEMILRIDGTELTRIRPGKCKTFTVTIPAGQFLHADENGCLRVEPSPADTTALLLPPPAELF